MHCIGQNIKSFCVCVSSVRLSVKKIVTLVFYQSPQIWNTASPSRYEEKNFVGKSEVIN